MKLTTSPQSPLNGTVILPGDKSLSHRAALFAALANGESRIENFLDSGVTRAMLAALTALGIAWDLDGKTLRMSGKGLLGFRPPAEELNCGNSATTLRLLAGALAGAGIPAILTGSAGLCRRPMERIVQPLQEMGARVEATRGCAPLILKPSSLPLKPLTYTLPVASAQVKTCLLLAALSACGPTILREPALSRDHSELMLRSMGVAVQSEKIRENRGIVPNGGFQFQTRLVPPAYPLALKPLQLALPGDFSAAAFLIVAALITPGSNVTIKNVGLNSTRTGLLDALIAMGGRIGITAQSTRSGEPAGDVQVQHSRLHGIQVSGEQVVQMIDEFPIFAVAAAFAEGISTVRDAAELRLKESDRIAALSQELLSLGVAVVESPDGFSIQGGVPIQGGTVHPHGDHRLAMSLAVAGLAAQGAVEVEGAEIITESFPEFMLTLQTLGADLNAS